MTAFILITLLGSFVALGLALWPLRSLRMLRCCCIGILLLISLMLAYWAWGGWRACQTYAVTKEKQQKAQAIAATMRDPQTIIRRLKAHLAQHPQSGKGWYLLGRLYASQNQWLEAEFAFSQAHQLHPEDERISVNWAQSLFGSAQVSHARQARILLKRMLATHPAQPDALALLAMDAYTQKAYQEAIDYWQRLLTLLPPDSEEAKAIQRAIAEAEAHRQS